MTGSILILRECYLICQAGKVQNDDLFDQLQGSSVYSKIDLSYAAWFDKLAPALFSWPLYESGYVEEKVMQLHPNTCMYWKEAKDLHRHMPTLKEGFGRVFDAKEEGDFISITPVKILEKEPIRTHDLELGAQVTCCSKNVPEGGWCGNEDMEIPISQSLVSVATEIRIKFRRSLQNRFGY
ncbi:hypothetical protein Tco_0991291 [Tanacetum coccineum]|uniref:Uncharacterized protein n=1 Tax=Tanacetum coccineum TaxID=301880 RepID=A0ABQ5EZ75_9ASTR